MDGYAHKTVLRTRYVHWTNTRNVLYQHNLMPWSSISSDIYIDIYSSPHLPRRGFQTMDLPVAIHIPFLWPFCLFSIISAETIILRARKFSTILRKFTLRLVYIRWRNTLNVWKQIEPNCQDFLSLQIYGKKSSPMSVTSPPSLLQIVSATKRR